MVIKFLILLFGELACSSAVIFIKASHEHPILLAAYRLFVAAIALTPAYISAMRAQPEYRILRGLRQAFLPGALLALHFISWIIGARMTPSANASLIVNLVPVVMPVFLIVMFRESLTRAELVGTIVAMSGTAMLFVTDFNLSRAYFLGDAVCFLSMLFFGFYLILARKNRQNGSIWLYVVPVYAIAGVICFVIALAFVSPIKPYTLGDIAIIAALGLIPTVVGHSILNYSMLHVRSQVVSIMSLTQFIFAGISGYFFFREIPDRMFYVVSLLVCAGSLISFDLFANRAKR
ncbi:hypothetical protein ANT_22730 [Candidatus Moduliflexus flocculans]|uniref:EamA domain-containing protein n=1 Tax=Candidatus Moduliflexus flocculans TaxID=1499966 RepID=A0A0S6VWB6_9BACT|nr:hypothetical protein ANT_22730 [Candidatus Moduliflexus flocculans]